MPLFGGKIEGIVAEQVRSLLAAETAFTVRPAGVAPLTCGGSRRAPGAPLRPHPELPRHHRHRRPDRRVPRRRGRLDRRGGLPLRPGTGWFFTRQVVRADSLPFDVDELRDPVRRRRRGAGRWQASWTVTDTASQAGGAAGQRRRRTACTTCSAGWRPASCRSSWAVIGNHEALGEIVRAHGVPFHHVPASAAGSGRERPPFAEVASWSTSTSRTRWSSPGSCRSCRRGCAAAGRAGAQHPPQLPALVRRRPALPPGARPRGEADRRHLPLRDGGPGRRPDHRAGRDPGRPRRHRGGHGAARRDIERLVLAGACGGTWRTGCSCTATRPSSSARGPHAIWSVRHRRRALRSLTEGGAVREVQGDDRAGAGVVVPRGGEQPSLGDRALVDGRTATRRTSDADPDALGRHPEVTARTAAGAPPSTRSSPNWPSGSARARPDLRRSGGAPAPQAGDGEGGHAAVQQGTDASPASRTGTRPADPGATSSSGYRDPVRRQRAAPRLHRPERREGTRDPVAPSGDVQPRPPRRGGGRAPFVIFPPVQRRSSTSPCCHAAAMAAGGDREGPARRPGDGRPDHQEDHREQVVRGADRLAWRERYCADVCGAPEDRGRATESGLWIWPAGRRRGGRTQPRPSPDVAVNRRPPLGRLGQASGRKPPPGDPHGSGRFDVDVAVEDVARVVLALIRASRSYLAPYAAHPVVVLLGHSVDVGARRRGRTAGVRPADPAPRRGRPPGPRRPGDREDERGTADHGCRRRRSPPDRLRSRRRLGGSYSMTLIGERAAAGASHHVDHVVGELGVPGWTSRGSTDPSSWPGRTSGSTPCTASA